MVSIANKWKATILICVIVPVAFLVAWQIGWIGQPATETINLEPVNWEFTHPTGYLQINQWQNASFVDNVCSIAFAIEIGDYVPLNSASGTLRFLTRVDILGKSPNFYVKTASVSFANLTESFDVEVNPFFINFENLSLAGQVRVGAGSVGFVGNSRSKSAYLSAAAEWAVKPPANLTCQATAVLEIVYFNGTSYRRIEQPTNLILRGDRLATLQIDAGLWADLPVYGVKTTIWVNDVSYTTPISLLLPYATYVVQVDSPIMQNSQYYSFLSWSTGDPSNPLTLNLTADVTLHAQFIPI